MKRLRCRWASNLDDQLMIAYHDNEYGNMIDDEDKLFELLALETMQTGLSWRLVLQKRAALNQAFSSFVIKDVALMDLADVDDLIARYDIIKNKQKLKAIINNAQVIVNKEVVLQDFIIAVFNEFQEDYQLSVKAYKKMGFKFIGPSIIKSMYEALGLIEAHEETCFLRKKE